MSENVDLLLVIPSHRQAIYQDLADDLAAIEPPTWGLLLASSMQGFGFTVAITDANAEALADSEVVERIEELNPRLIVFVAYGQNVNAGTASMSGVSRMAKYFREQGVSAPVALIGSYAQALPRKCLEDEQAIDFLFTNEGIYSLRATLSLPTLDVDALASIRGIAYRAAQRVVINPGEMVVPNEQMDAHLPGYAWELLAQATSPLDLYRSPYWHAGYISSSRTPYAAIQTSLGCSFRCSFCMINTINREDDEAIGVASRYNKMRFWSPSHVLRQIDTLVDLGVRTIRITDEMFLLNRRYYEPLLTSLSQRPYAEELRMWAYSRVDTIRDPEQLRLARRAGIRWLCLGIESANREVRLEVSKGKFKDVDIRDVVAMVHEADIDVLANYIVGLPGESVEDMEATLNLSLELCTSGWNMYPAMALPGSELYVDALKSSVDLPQTYEGFSFHSFETLPLPSGRASAEDALRFRDQAFIRYHSDRQVRAKIRDRFGPKAEDTLDRMLAISMKRRLLGDTA